LRPARRVVETGKYLPLFDGRAFFDQHFGNASGRFRGNRRLPACNHIT
jgi:hypothetical protein